MELGKEKDKNQVDTATWQEDVKWHTPHVLGNRKKREREEEEEEEEEEE